VTDSIVAFIWRLQVQLSCVEVLVHDSCSPSDVEARAAWARVARVL